MGVANSTSFRGTVLILVSLTLASSSSFARQLLFSSQIPPEYVQLLVSDLQNDLSLVEAEDVTQMMGIANLSDRSLKQWLLARIGYVIGENENEQGHIVELGQAFYPQNGAPIIPQRLPEPDPNGASSGLENRPNGPRQPAQKPKAKPVTVMSNVGVAYYYSGKMSGTLLGYKFVSTKASGVIRVVSPRVGLLKVGKGLFGIVPFRQNPKSLVNTWFRLMTLFHEAHHSDGNGPSLGFMHANCPPGHKYANRPACDMATNGPYEVERVLIRQARQTCQSKGTCNAAEAEMLSLFETDSQSRLLGNKAWDPRPEGINAGARPGT